MAASLSLVHAAQLTCVGPLEVIAVAEGTRRAVASVTVLPVGVLSGQLCGPATDVSTLLA